MIARILVLVAVPVLAAFLMFDPLTGFAHGPKLGPNGGQIQDAGMYHLELIVGSGELRVYVSDANDRPVPTTGAKASAIVLANKKTVKLALSPTGANELHGRGPFTSPGVLKVVLSLTFPGKKAVMARFAFGQ